MSSIFGFFLMASCRLVSLLVQIFRRPVQWPDAVRTGPNSQRSRELVSETLRAFCTIYCEDSTKAIARWTSCQAPRTVKEAAGTRSEAIYVWHLLVGAFGEACKREGIHPGTVVAIAMVEVGSWLFVHVRMSVARGNC